MTNQSNDPLTQFINEHPRQALQILMFSMSFIWESWAAFIGVVLFLVLIRLCRIRCFLIFVMSGLIVAGILSYVYVTKGLDSIVNLGQTVFILNKNFWQICFQGGFWEGLSFLFENGLANVVGVALGLLSLLLLIELIPESPHQRALKALHRAESFSYSAQSAKQLQKKVSKLTDINFKGTVLGLSLTSGKPICVSDATVNQIVLILGTTGGGKSVTLRRFYQRAVSQGFPLIIVNGKPTDEEVQWVQELTEKYQRRFYGFNCGNHFHYDCLAEGGFTELKDKIMTLKTEWSSDHYKSIAGDYLQTVFEVLLKRGTSFDLRTVVECLNFEELALIVRQMNEPYLCARVERLTHYESDDITGLRAHLSMLVFSELGHYFTRGEQTFNLPQVLRENAVAYFALPALRFPDFTTVLGNLVINDIKAVIGRQSRSKPIFTIFDEFSVFAGEQVLNLVNMGRGKGIHAVFGTQGLADLQKVDSTFENQMLNCANTLICHRLNESDGAEKVSIWAGTRETFDVTAQISNQQSNPGLGSVSRNKEFIIHPDAIKQSLQPGEAFYITKVEQFSWDRVIVKYS